VRNGVRQANARTPRARGSGVGVTSEGTDTRADVMLRIWCAVILRSALSMLMGCAARSRKDVLPFYRIADTVETLWP
jgi:hypothetical protein